MDLGSANARGQLTTHVLDTASGNPAAGLRIELQRHSEGRFEPVLSVRTNADGRCDAPLLAGPSLFRGVHELVFHVGDYFRARGVMLQDPAFLDLVPVRFGISDLDRHYHVPLLISPFGYATYRGS